MPTVFTAPPPAATQLHPPCSRQWRGLIGEELADWLSTPQLSEQNPVDHMCSNKEITQPESGLRGLGMEAWIWLTGHIPSPWVGTPTGPPTHPPNA